MNKKKRDKRIYLFLLLPAMSTRLTNAVAELKGREARVYVIGKLLGTLI